MPDHCLPQIHFLRTRISVVDFTTGIPDPGVGNMYVSSAVTRLGLEYVYLDGDEITDRNGSGALCLDYRGDDNFRRVNWTLELCDQDPVLSSLLAGDLLTEGGRLGWAAPEIGVVPQYAVSIEGWASRINDGVLDADFPYAWHVLPFCKNIRPGNRELANTRQANIFTGQGYENANWYDGPTGDWPGVASDRAHQWVEATAAELPTAQCGAIELVAS